MGDPVLRTEASEVETFDEELRALLGEEGHDMLGQYEQTQMERTQVDLFKERLTGDLSLDWETQHELILAMSDAREGVTSFLEKRDPNWTLRPSQDTPDVFPWLDEPEFS